jgi:hypothetical protein
MQLHQKVVACKLSYDVELVAEMERRRRMKTFLTTDTR